MDDKDKTLNDNKIYKEHQDPNWEAKTLRRYKQYLASSERIVSLNKARDTSKEKLQMQSGMKPQTLLWGKLPFLLVAVLLF